ncbi:GtrA family protein [Patescibacteria group bacterium]|nr:MAG: GtrA family protein [Patescibacteria group bacterium]
MAHRKKNETRRLAEYLVSGGAWFWSGYLLFALLFSVFGVGVVPAKIVSYIFGLTVNFLLQRFWVFDSRDARKQLDVVTGRYVVLSVVNLGIDTLIVWSLNEAGLTPYIGQFVSAGFFTVWNYVWYKLWVFAKKTAPGPRRAAAPVIKRPKHVSHTVKRRKK